MRTSMIVAVAVLECLVVVACKTTDESPTGHARPGPTVTCPTGTTYSSHSTDNAIRAKSYFPQSEEFCVKPGTDTREGPYIQRGPNGEALVEGQYIDGKQEGTWISRLPSQTQIGTFEHGVATKKVATRGREGFTSIDVARCVPHSFEFPLGLGSVWYAATGREGETCVIDVGGETEGGQHGIQRCRFPASLARVAFQLTSSNITFGDAHRYCGPAK